MDRIRSRHEGKEECMQSFSRNPEVMRLLRRRRHGWEDNIKINLREIGCCGTDCSDLAQDTD
jgi:hypothetical protein